MALPRLIARPVLIVWLLRVLRIAWLRRPRLLHVLLLLQVLLWLGRPQYAHCTCMCCCCAGRHRGHESVPRACALRHGRGGMWLGPPSAVAAASAASSATSVPGWPSLLRGIARLPSRRNFQVHVTRRALSGCALADRPSASIRRCIDAELHAARPAVEREWRAIRHGRRARSHRAARLRGTGLCDLVLGRLGVLARLHRDGCGRGRRHHVYASTAASPGVVRLWGRGRVVATQVHSAVCARAPHAAAGVEPVAVGRVQRRSGYRTWGSGADQQPEGAGRLAQRSHVLVPARRTCAM